MYIQENTSVDPLKPSILYNKLKGSSQVPATATIAPKDTVSTLVLSQKGSLSNVANDQSLTISDGVLIAKNGKIDPKKLEREKAVNDALKHINIYNKAPDDMWDIKPLSSSSKLYEKVKKLLTEISESSVGLEQLKIIAKSNGNIGIEANYGGDPNTEMKSDIAGKSNSLGVIHFDLKTRKNTPYGTMPAHLILFHEMQHTKVGILGAGQDTPPQAKENGVHSNNLLTEREYVKSLDEKNRFRGFYAAKTKSADGQKHLYILKKGSENMTQGPVFTHREGSHFYNGKVKLNTLKYGYNI